MGLIKMRSNQHSDEKNKAQGPKKPVRRMKRRGGMPSAISPEELHNLLKYAAPKAPIMSFLQGDVGYGPSAFRQEVTALVRDMFPVIGKQTPDAALRFLCALSAALQNMSIHGWMSMSFRRTGEELALLFNTLFPEYNGPPVDYLSFYCCYALEPDLDLLRDLQAAVEMLEAAPCHEFNDV